MLERKSKIGANTTRNDARSGTALIVLGMHRSGTSAITRALSSAGLALPLTLIPPAPDNERGFWESKPIKELNENILSFLGQSWSSFAVIEDDVFNEGWMKRCRTEAEELLRQEIPPACGFVLKDPRFCRLLPLWKDVLNEAARRVVFVNVIRDPTEVAQSLHVRNGLSPQHGMVLWARYSLDAERRTRGHDRAFVHFAEFLQDWRSSVEKLSDALGLSLDVRSGGEDIDEYLSPELRHHVARNDVEPLFSVVRETYEVLCRWSRGARESDPDYRKLDSARSRLDEFAGILSSLFDDSRKNRELVDEVNGRLKGVESRIDAAQRGLEQDDGRASDVRTELAAAGADLRIVRNRLTRTSVAGEWSPREWIAWLHGSRLAPTDIGAPMEVVSVDTGVTAPNDGAMRTGIVRYLFSGMPKGQRVADLGAGPCIFAKIARDAGHDVTAVDARTVRKPPDEELGSIKFVHGDVRDFDVSGFDIVLFLGLLYHFDIEDQEEMLRRCNSATVILDCEVHVPELVQGTPKEWQTTVVREGAYEGVRYPEDDNPMASVGNETSFWHTEESMTRLFKNAGYDRLAIIDPLFTSKYGGRRFYVAS